MKSKLDNHGFTYLMALMLIMVMGIMLGAVGQTWRSILQRDREEELIFRGRQIKSAIEDWNSKDPRNTPPTRLNELKDLVQDPRTPSGKRRLRRVYLDPITGKDFKVIPDPAKGIVGVYSPSEAKPLKTGNFPDDLKEFVEKQHYSEWKFMLSGSSSQAPPGLQPRVSPGPGVTQ